MNQRRFLLKMLMLFDVGILAACYLLASAQTWHLSAYSSYTQFFSMRIKVLNLLLSLGLLVAWHLTFQSFGLYSSKRMASRMKEALDILGATACAAVVLTVAALVFRIHMVTPGFILRFWCASSLSLVLCRLFMRHALALVRRHGRNRRHLLIVGTNQRAQAFARFMESRPELGYQLVGFADDAWEGNRSFSANGASTVTSLQGFSAYLRAHVVDEVVIALPLKSLYDEAARIVAECHEQGVVVRGLGHVFDFPQTRIAPRNAEIAPMLTYSTNLFEGRPLVCKRLLDVVSALLLLISLAPFLLLVALLVVFDSSGPALFIQERVGLNKRKFRMYKFRTMVAHAERQQLHLEKLNEADGPVFKIRKDPRITRVGSFLRKTSIDELPQLWNVLKGDMSLVGPRPLPLRDYQGFDQCWIHRRFSVRPGLTCLWQVHGRSATTFGRWMELDIQYIDTWSFWLDVKILAKTLPAVLAGRGAA